MMLVGVAVGVANSDVILCDVPHMYQPPRLHSHILYWLPRQQIFDVSTPEKFLQKKERCLSVYQ